MTLAEGGDYDRTAAAAFYHLLAVAHLQDGHLADARCVAAKAVAAWRLSRLAMLGDNRLANLF